MNLHWKYFTTKDFEYIKWREIKILSTWEWKSIRILLFFFSFLFMHFFFFCVSDGAKASISPAASTEHRASALSTSVFIFLISSCSLSQRVICVPDINAKIWDALPAISRTRARVAPCLDDRRWACEPARLAIKPKSKVWEWETIWWECKGEMRYENIYGQTILPTGREYYWHCT